MAAKKRKVTWENAPTLAERQKIFAEEALPVMTEMRNHFLSAEQKKFFRAPWGETPEEMADWLGFTMERARNKAPALLARARRRLHKGLSPNEVMKDLVDGIMEQGKAGNACFLFSLARLFEKYETATSSP